jgi:hypothetical protein
VQLPTPLVHRLENFSLDNQRWLNKYYITQKHCADYGIYEHEGSLIFTLSDDCYQQRWLSPRRILTFGQKNARLFDKNTESVVICEDFISAVRLAEHTSALCLSGTKTKFHTIKDLVSKYSQIIVWLDNDEEKEINSGQESAKIICKMVEDAIQYNNREYAFGLTEKTCRNIATEHDPKAYSDSELRSILS